MHTCRSLCLSVVVLLLWLFFPLVGAAQTAKPSPQDIYQMAANSVVSIEAHNRALERMVQAGARPMTALTRWTSKSSRGSQVSSVAPGSGTGRVSR